MAALEDVVLVKFDAEKGEGKELAAEYKVQGYPTFVFANADGEVMDTWSGYGKSSFLGMVAPAVADPTTMEEKTARFANAPTADDGVRVARYHATRGAYETALGFVDATSKLDGAPDMTMTAFDYTSSAFTRADIGTVEDVVAAADAVIANADAKPGDVVQVASTMAYVGRKVENVDLGNPYLAPALAATKDSDDEYFMGAHDQMAVAYALRVEKDEDKAVELKMASMSEGWKDDPTELNSFAWWCFEANANLSEALVMARRGAELASAGVDRARILDTAAEICNAQGNCDDAVELMQQALADSPDSEYYQKQLTRFEEIRKTSQAN